MAVDGPLDAGSPSPAKVVQGYLAENAVAAAKHIDRYCELSRQLARTNAAPRPRGQHDAASYLAPRVDWSNGRLGLLHLPASLTDRMGNPAQAWRSFGPADYAGLDFTWLTELQAFDVWTVGSAGPLRDADEVTASTLAVNWAMLQQWAKLSLIKGLRENDLERAAAEVLHLGALCQSTSFLLGKLYGASMYGLARSVWESSGRPVPDSIPSVDDVKRLRLLSIASVDFLLPGVPRAIQERSLECGLDRCASVTEATLAAAAMREVVPETAELLTWLRARSSCDPFLTRRIEHGRPASPLEVQDAPRQWDLWLDRVDAQATE